MIMLSPPSPTINTHLSNMSKVVENKPYNRDNKTTPACTQHTQFHSTIRALS